MQFQLIVYGPNFQEAWLLSEEELCWFPHRASFMAESTMGIICIFIYSTAFNFLMSHWFELFLCTKASPTW